MDQRKPLVSVLMVAYNSARFINQAMNSVLAQTCTDFELIVIDDNSSDDSWRIIEAFSDPRLKKIRNSSNLGEYQNRNKAIDVASGEYSIFIDADDLMYSHGLQFMMQYAVLFPECGMIISRPWDERIIFPAKLSPRQFYCFEYIDKGAAGINFTKVLFKTEVLKSFERFPESVRLGDLYLQYFVGLTQSTLLIPDASTWWRRSPGQASELYLKDYAQYVKHELWIKLQMLRSQECPLSDEEKAIAFMNLYGNYLRFLARCVFKLRVRTVFDLLRQYPVRLRHFATIFQRQKRDYFDSYSGQNPFQ
jgi:glycosyltransferase involved in cell wall biosynthesis